MNDFSQKLFIGLAQWHHPDWYPEQLKPQMALATYAQHFSSVEGNNTFYGLPSVTTISQWKEQSSSTFRFCFKFPQEITHQRALHNCHRPLSEFLDRVYPLNEKLGLLWLQMPATFSPAHLDDLAQFLTGLPKDFSFGIEIRHLGFFAKDDAERRFNQLMMSHNINRVCFDTRSLFAYPQTDAITQEALKAKPRVPVHVIATGSSPMVRFITPLDMSQGYAYLTPWISKTLEWIHEGRTPYLFFHTPDNRFAPQLAKYFMDKLYEQASLNRDFSLWDNTPPQTELF